MKKRMMWDELIAMWKSNFILAIIVVILLVLNILVFKNNPVINGLVFGVNITILSNLLAKNIVDLHNDFVWDKLIKKLEKIDK